MRLEKAEFVDASTINQEADAALSEVLAEFEQAMPAFAVTEVCGDSHVGVAAKIVQQLNEFSFVSCDQNQARAFAAQFLGDGATNTTACTCQNDILVLNIHDLPRPPVKLLSLACGKYRRRVDRTFSRSEQYDLDRQCLKSCPSGIQKNFM